MRVELKIYTTRRQRQQLRKLHRYAADFVTAFLTYIVPLIEAAAGLTALFLMCCMDSENLGGVVGGYCAALFVLGGCYLLRHYSQMTRSRQLHYRYLSA